MIDQIYTHYGPFATEIMKVYRYLREDRQEFRVSGKIESDCLAIDDLMETCTMDSFGDAIAKIEHVQRLLTQLQEAGYLGQAQYDSVSRQADAFKDYLADQYNRMKSSREAPIPQETYEQAVQLAREMGQISVSMLQRRLHVGYAQAGKIIELLEDQGVIAPAKGALPHKTL